MNHKKYIYLPIAVLFLLFWVLFFSRSYLNNTFCDTFYQTNTEIPLALYGGNNSPEIGPVPHFSSFTLKWVNTSIWFNQKPLVKALSANQNVFLTVQTFAKRHFPFKTNTNVLEEILAGGYDKKINLLGSILAKSNGEVFVSYDPEMEVPVTRYPWQFQSPGLYIDAFNYFASRIKKMAPKVKIVWSPAGYPGDTEYWPGARFVDFASITLGDASEKQTVAYPVNGLPMVVTLRQKLHRMRFINKPIFILAGDDHTRNHFNLVMANEATSDIVKYKNTIYSVDNYAGTDSLKPQRQKIAIGVFDPQKKLVGLPEISVEHLFTDWGQIERGETQQKLDEVSSRHHNVILTMEPWRDTSSKEDTAVLVSILNGRYDVPIKKLFGMLSAFKNTVYLRFAHEMEIPIHRYAWQSQNPVTYINAYRYFMHFDNSRGKNIFQVWGPAGDRGSIDFWPGNDAVDYISIAIYGLPDKNITDPNKQESFTKIFNRKIYRMRLVNKPIFITEFGVKGPEAFQTKWLLGAAKTINQNRQVFGACYFNLYDNPKAWGNIKAPDWSISKYSFLKFYAALLHK